MRSRALTSLLLIGIPAAVALASIVGWIVAGAALRPVERLRQEADAISASEPGRRLPVPATGDELSRLAASLNRMLGRLEEAMEQERRFVADASHELRTPLANLRAEVDLALRRARTADELGAALRSVREETERLGRLAEDLLVLARLSEDGLHLRREPTDLGRLVAETADSFAGRAEGLGVELVTEVGWRPRGARRWRAPEAGARESPRQRPSVHAARGPGDRRGEGNVGRPNAGGHRHRAGLPGGVHRTSRGGLPPSRSSRGNGRPAARDSASRSCGRSWTPTGARCASRTQTDGGARVSISLPSGS